MAAAQLPPVRWGLLGTASIAASAFLPGLAAAGGVPYAVAGRDPARTRSWAHEHGVLSAVDDMAALLADPAVEAVYVPLPNAVHADWTVAALQAGKAVLCEKPLAGSVAETARVLAAARATGGLLWEAFVFPFSPQTALVQRLLGNGEIGDLRTIHGEFHFRLTDEADIRFDAGLDGGALNDVGCYPLRLARLLLGADPVAASATQYARVGGVDTQTAGCLTFPDERQLVFSCGFDRPYSAFTRVIGTDGELRLDNAYHPSAQSSCELWRDGQRVETHPGPPLPSFAYALRHVHKVLRGDAEPRHLALAEALPNALALELVRSAVSCPDRTAPAR